MKRLGNMQLLINTNSYRLNLLPSRTYIGDFMVQSDYLGQLQCFLKISFEVHYTYKIVGAQYY